MACTFGRITSLQSPDTIRRDGDQLTLGGSFEISSSVNGQVLADQLLGYGLHNVDEPVISFTYDATLAGNALDGFYFVVKTTVNYAKLAAGLFVWTAELVKVAGFKAPLFEIVSSGALRVNSHGITTANTLAWVAGLPPAPTFAGTAITTSVTRTGEGPSDLFVFYDTAETAFNAHLLNSPVAADFYKGAAKIETSADSGATWSTVTGRQVTVSAAADVRLNNSLVRLKLTSAQLDIQHHDGTQWETTKLYTLGESGNFMAWFTTTAPVTILRNSPEAVTMRFATIPTAAGSSGLPYLDATLRRGSRFLEFFWYGNVASLGVRRSTAEAATALTGGVRATANDANGNRYVMATPLAKTNDLVNGGFSQTASRSFPFMIGSAIAGSSAVAGDSTDDLVNQYMAAMEHRQRAVDR